MLLALLIPALCAIACYAIGTPKGYGGAICAVAGFFGGIIGIIIIALLPDREEEAATAARRDSARDREISDLKKRISELEASQPKAEPSEPEDPFPAAPAEPDAPVVFSTRTEEPIECPRCGRKQKGNRSACYSCGTPFVYETE